MKQFLFVALCVATSSVYAQSAFRDFANAVDATVDAAREAREQSTADATIRAIFDKAKRAKASGGVDFCGFYVGMEKADATTLVGYYGLGYDDSSFEGDPLVHSIHFSLVGVRKVMKGGNSFEELCQGVANRVGDLKYSNDLFDGQKWEYKTIDGLVVKIRELESVNAFIMEDTTGKTKNRSEAERKSRQAAVKRAAEREFNVDSVSIQERPLMEVSLPNNVSMRFRQLPNGLWFGETEVTQEQWESLMGNNPSDRKWPTRPVNQVSWRMSQGFIQQFNKHASKDHADLVFRLPNPDEWSYACKAGGNGEYCLAANGKEVTTETLDLIAWTKDNSEDQTHPVGKKMANAWGLFDMLGNVSEWGPKDEAKNKSQCFNYGHSFNTKAETDQLGNGLHIAFFFKRKYDAFSSSSDNECYPWNGIRLCASSRKEEVLKKNEQEKRKKDKDTAAIATLIADMVEIPKKEYKIGKFEVTQAQWSAIMGNNPCERKGDMLPIENITWNECQRFLKKLNSRPEVKAAGLRFRLPIAEEWWYACHAGSSEIQGEPNCYLEDGTLITEKSFDRVGWMLKTGDYVGYDNPRSLGGLRILSETHPGGKKTPNAFGLYDMFGNVREMIDTECGEVDQYAKGDSYEHHHICCGGSWKENPSAWSWARSRIGSTDAFDDVGFRLCAETINTTTAETNEAEASESTAEACSQDEKDNASDSFAEAFGLSAEELESIDSLPRIIDFELMLRASKEDESLQNDLENPGVLLTFLRSARTCSLLDNLDERIEVKLIFGLNQKTITVSSKEDVDQGVKEYLEALPDSVEKRELLKLFVESGD